MFALLRQMMSRGFIFAVRSGLLIIYVHEMCLRVFIFVI